MSRTLVIGISTAAVGLATTASAQKAPFGTAAEAKAMVERVVAELKPDQTAALTKFNKPDGEFRDRDLYVFCFNSATGIFNAHIRQPLIGTDIRLLKEQNGSPLGQKIFDAASGAEEATIVTVSYNFPKPNSEIPVPKESFVVRVGNEACGVGYYK